ncbi:MAG: triose-phosphate isomerase [Gemmatimonadota bacterium]
MKRQVVVAGNWKMNLGPGAAAEYASAFEPPRTEASVKVVLFPPTLAFSALREALRERGRTEVELGVQNIYWERAGAYTGETSPVVAREVGAAWALVGHSERRHLFGEKNSDVARKTRAALESGLLPLVCVGETWEERQAGRLTEVLESQLTPVLEVIQEVGGSGPSGAPAFHLAYEPVWAIGTGQTATPDDATQAHGFLRGRLVSALPGAESQRISILYGGSVSPSNVRELLAAPEVDGVLVGGASLDPLSFAELCLAGSEAGGA